MLRLRGHVNGEVIATLYDERDANLENPGGAPTYSQPITEQVP